MIAFPNFLPLIQLDDGAAVPFEPEWLTCSLARAARSAGLAQWWLAPHVTASVTEYLRADHQGSTIDATRLEQAVRAVLQVIGYAEVGKHFAVGRPVLAISLADLVREAGSGYELAFFQLLAHRLAEACAAHTPHFQLVGLDRCVRMLRACKNWTRECAALRAEIVEFTRTHASRAAAAHDVTFSLS